LRRWIIWLALIGIFLPYTFGSTGKYVIASLFPLAVISLVVAIFRERRRFMASDFFVWAAALWMFGAEISVTSLSLSTGSDALAFVGAYMVARAFLLRPASFREFFRAFKVISIALIALSLLDTLSGYFVISNLMKAIFHANVASPSIVKGQGDIYRNLFGQHILRAASTFPHPILYGTFCAIAAAIFLYSEQTLVSRSFYVVVCFIGCVLSISSGPLLGFLIAVAIYCYDFAFNRYRWRWKVFWAVIAAVSLAIALLLDNPLGFIFRHLIFNPETGYYRILIWQHAFNFIANSPLTGDPTGSAWVADDILSNSVDCVWLVLALLHGIPTALFLFLAVLAACVRVEQKHGLAPYDSEIQWIQRLRTGFSLALAVFALVGLTVHFWDAIWMFWALCLGVRASLEEYFVALNRRCRLSQALAPHSAKYRQVPLYL
jgi:hypothetical protein